MRMHVDPGTRAVGWCAVWPKPFRLPSERIAEFVRGREPQSDDTFIAACGFSRGEGGGHVAVVVRRLLAEESGVAPELIHAADRYPGELEGLPRWSSSPDLIDLVLDLERRLDVRIADRDVEALLVEPWSVAEFVQRIAAIRERGS